jgi:DNA-binding transcriptional MocR family regulator
VYVTPTTHNPTGASMGRLRRAQIAAVCARHDVAIVEDDVYSIFRPHDVTPIARIAPERTFYVNGFSKSLSPGLRLGMLVAPPVFSGCSRRRRTR